MNEIGQVLAGTAFSEQSRIAIRRAALICREHAAQLELLHVVEAGGLISSDQDLEEAKGRLQEEIGVAVSLGIDCGGQVVVGKNVAAIINRAREMTAHLVVIGAHGQRSWRDNFFGASAEKLLRKATFPLLVVKQPSPSPYRRVLVPTDFSEASRQALAAASMLAPGANIDLLHVYGFSGEEQLNMAQAGEEALEQYRQRTEMWAMTSMDEWRQGIDLAGHQVEEHLRKGYAAAVITQFAAERRSDLVVMGTVGSSGHHDILLGSVTEYVLSTLSCDILAVR